MINKLKQFRKINKLSQQELADAVNVSRITISNIERYVYIPSLELASKLANYFDVKIEDLFLFEKE